MAKRKKAKARKPKAQTTRKGTPLFVRVEGNRIITNHGVFEDEKVEYQAGDCVTLRGNTISSGGVLRRCESAGNYFSAHGDDAAKGLAEQLLRCAESLRSAIAVGNLDRAVGAACDAGEKYGTLLAYINHGDDAKKGHADSVRRAEGNKDRALGKAELKRRWDMVHREMLELQRRGEKPTKKSAMENVAKALGITSGAIKTNLKNYDRLMSKG